MTMAQKRLLLIIGHPLQGKYFLLLAALVLLLLIYPFIQTAVGFRILDLFLATVLLAAVNAVHRQPRIRLTALLLALPALVATVISYLTHPASMLLLSQALMAVFLLFASIAVLADVLRDESVTVDKIFGAICVYLLIGLIWVLLYSLLDHLQPGAIRIEALSGETHPSPLHIEFSDYLYFSFITLTTLGYGDVVPVSHIARHLSFLEALLGQLYLTILVARLVGLHIARPHDRSRQTD